MLLKLRYQYSMTLCLANRTVKMEQIKKEIEKCIEIYNIRSQTSKNVKEISSYEIKDDLFYAVLSSETALINPSRGLFSLTQSIVQLLRDEGKEDLINEITKRKSFFRSVGKPKEVKNLKLEKTVNLEAPKVTTNISLVEAHKIITDIFFNDDIKSNEKEEVKEKILELLKEYQVNKEK